MPRSRPLFPEHFRREAAVSVRSAPDRSVSQIRGPWDLRGDAAQLGGSKPRLIAVPNHGRSSDEREELRRRRREVSILPEKREFLKKEHP